MCYIKVYYVLDNDFLGRKYYVSNIRKDEITAEVQPPCIIPFSIF